ncbi:unnamed protein product [Calypogeia fissa]
MMTKEQALIDLVAPTTISARSKKVATAVNGTPSGEIAPTPKEPPDIEMVEAIPQKPRRTVAQRMDSSGSDMDQGSTPSGSQQNYAPSTGVEEQVEQVVERRPPIIAGGPHLPQYLQNVSFANHHSSTRRLVEELGALST